VSGQKIKLRFLIGPISIVLAPPKFNGGGGGKNGDGDGDGWRTNVFLVWIGAY